MRVSEEVSKALKDRLVMRLTPPTNRSQPGAKTQRGVIYVVIAAFSAMTIVAIGLARAAPNGGATVGFTAFLVFLAASAVGAGLGFLFGLPRSRLPDVEPPADTSKGTQAPPSARHYLNNSNLIKVSDWATTIVVGLTLVNLDALAPAIRSLGETLSPALGGQSSSAVVGVCITIFGVLFGFIANFLWVSIRVRELMEEAETWKETEEVPELKGLTVREAINAVATVQLRLVVPPGSSVDAKVNDQEPKAGTLLRKGAEVQLVV